MKYLGKTFDIHTGGVDNMFPHHEDEIAQSESANGCRFVNYWLHCEHLTIDKKKMSKSLGNFYTLRDLEAKGYTGREVRWVLIGTHYRSKLNFSLGALDAARAALAKFDQLFARLKAAAAGESLLQEARDAAAAGKEAFAAAVSDDLNISEALSALFVLTKTTGRLLANGLQAAGAKILLDQFRDFDRVFGALDVDAVKEEPAALDAPAEILELVAARTEAKKAKDFAKADAIRDQLKELGWSVVDKPTGPVPVKL